MPRRLCYSITFVILYLHAVAQHADMGSGNLRGNIWWFDWNGFKITEGASRTFTTDGGLVVTIVFSNVSPLVPVPSVMNTWSGALLHILYDFSDGSLKPALYRYATTVGEINTFTLTIRATRNGSPVPFRIVTSDAESSTPGELTTFQTDGTSWETLDFFRNSAQTYDPLTGCGTGTVIMSGTGTGAAQIGQLPILSSTSPTGAPLTLGVEMFHKDTHGGMGVAFGILESLDRGDLPASYGSALHELTYNVINSCNTTAPLPALEQTNNLMLGSIPADADAIQYEDDNLHDMADEDGVASFQRFDASGAYTVNMPYSNQTGQTAYISGFFDINRDGRFESGETIVQSVANGSGTVAFTWAVPGGVLPNGTGAGFGFRFRISSDPAAVSQPTGYAKDGEVEDYYIPAGDLCPIFKARASSSNDIDCTHGQAILHATGGASYLWDSVPGITKRDVSDPIVRPPVTTMFYVTAFEGNGCPARDSVMVAVDFNTAPSTFSVPNAFTPNNDGHNDCFRLKYWGQTTILSILILDRWGQRVWFTNNPDDCWNGTRNGQPMPAGTYIYQVSATTRCGSASRTGTVMLIR